MEYFIETKVKATNMNSYLNYLNICESEVFCQEKYRINIFPNLDCSNSNVNLLITKMNTCDLSLQIIQVKC